jgi:hypothetical protein
MLATTAQDAKAAAAARGIAVNQIPPDHGHLWVASIPRKGRGAPPLARLLADSDEEAARAALRYLGVKGWI